MKVKRILESLDDTSKKKLNLAFDNCEPCFIKLPGNKYIGVNVEKFPQLKETDKEGEWSLGDINAS